MMGVGGYNLLPPAPLNVYQMQREAKEKSISELCKKRKKTKTVQEICNRWKK
jgi:hypothetical protein